MENHSSVTRWLELFSSYKSLLFSLQSLLLRYAAENLQVTLFQYALLACANKIFQKQTVFVFAES